MMQSAAARGPPAAGLSALPGTLFVLHPSSSSPCHCPEDTLACVCVCVRESGRNCTLDLVFSEAALCSVRSVNAAVLIALFYCRLI